MSAADIVELEREAVQRITSAQDVARIAGDMAMLVRTLPAEQAQKLYGAFLLMAEVLADLLIANPLPIEPQSAHTAQPADLPRRISDAEHCAAILNKFRGRDAGQRKQAVMGRTGWSRSKYYRELDAAEEMGLLR